MVKFPLLLLIAVTLVISGHCRTLVPYPSYYVQGDKHDLSVDPKAFTFKVISDTKSEIMEEVIRRYKDLIFFHKEGSGKGAHPCLGLQISVGSSDETLQQGTDESYLLEVDAPLANLTSNTIYGAMRGLETLSQLIDYSSANKSYTVFGAPHTISDEPRFQYRGLLVDTARHFETVDTLKSIIDGMSYAKLNVFHWHATDDQSFPFPSKSYPLLTKGAYDPSLTYSWDDVKDIVRFAKRRGVRVIPEFDTPAHALSWGIGYPDFLVPGCNPFSGGKTVNPIMDSTYDLLSGFLGDYQDIFFEDYLHIGADEVHYSCWLSNQTIVDWASSRGMNMSQLESMYVGKLQGILAGLNKKMMCWEECFDNNLSLPSDVMIGVWRNWGNCWGPCKLAEVTKAGKMGVLSAGWYLDDLDASWEDMYAVEPFSNMTKSPTQQSLVEGGESAMWGESVNEGNIVSRIFPRAITVSERLWSPMSITNQTDFEIRLHEFSCRNLRRGVLFGPWRPGYCLDDGQGALSPYP